MSTILQEMTACFSPYYLEEAAQRFDFHTETLVELEGSSFVYEGIANSKTCILKIIPGVCDGTQLYGSTSEQLLAELDFVQYLANHDVPVALPILSRNQQWIETIPVNETGCFLAYCFEKVNGWMYPDDDEVIFPDEILLEWGRLHGRIHALSSDYRPQLHIRRLDWEQNDLLDHASLIPAEQFLVHQRFEEVFSAIKELPIDADSYGFIHGDFHHGNFFVDEGKITIFDFDACTYFWYIGDIAISLYNCLPLPRTEREKRKDYAVHYLQILLRGYAEEKTISSFWIHQIPLFLKFCELVNYTYFYKYWDMQNLSERRQLVLSNFKHRIENNIPVLDLEEVNLEQLAKIFHKIH